MPDQPWNRRDFHKLTTAALGGFMAGSFAGCTKEPAPGKGSETAAAEIHLCRGLNTCKGQGGDHKNACAGVGDCATAKAHGCGGENECKGLGGCGENPGENSCKGQGGCSVPLMDDAWKKLRTKFEERMKKAGTKFGEAPPKKEKA